jgi:transposase-like protein
MSDLSRPEFHDAEKAREWLEAELWPNGPVCPKCGTVNQATLMHGETTRPGLYQCNSCREPFTVTVGTLYERSHVPLNKWLAATHLMMASKKGMSALEIGRLLGLSKKTAWFLCHRIRGSLRETKLAMPLGGQNKVVEADETYIGGKETNKNTVEGYFSILKRGIVGTFHHVSQQHLKRYLAEFDYRYRADEPWR